MRGPVSGPRRDRSAVPFRPFFLGPPLTGIPRAPPFSALPALAADRTGPVLTRNGPGRAGSDSERRTEPPSPEGAGPSLLAAAAGRAAPQRVCDRCCILHGDGAFKLTRSVAGPPRTRMRPRRSGHTSSPRGPAAGESLGQLLSEGGPFESKGSSLYGWARERWRPGQRRVTRKHSLGPGPGTQTELEGRAALVAAIPGRDLVIGT